MSYQIWEPGHLCPISILLTTSGSRGYKLLFRYPTLKQQPLTEFFERACEESTGMPNQKSRSTSSLEAFSLQLNEEGGVRTSINQDIIDASINSLKPNSYIENDRLSSELKDESLVNLLAVRNNFSKEKFYLKMEDVVFVGNQCGSSKFSIGIIDDSQTIRTFNVVFALRSTAPKTVQDSLYILAKSITSAICLEEKRCKFLSEERNIIQNLSDDIQEKSDDGQNPADLLLEKSQLCRDLKKIVDEISRTGFVFSTINNMVTMCHSIPQRVYHVIDNVYIDASSVMYAANNIKPYHTLIFLTSKEDILTLLPSYNLDFRKFLAQVSLKDSIMVASQKCGLPLNFCLKMASNLVLWGKAIICYQVTDSNMYWVAPFIDLSLSADLLVDFHNNFPSLFLPKVIQQLNAYQPYMEVLRHLCIDDDTGLQLIEWLTYNRLIYQMHKYFLATQYDGRDSGDFARIKSTMSAVRHKSMDEDTMALLTQLLTEYPMLCADNLAPDSLIDPDSVKLFTRILPLCNGDHHLEDIVFQVGEQRNEVIQCLDQFGSFLITVEHADPITACFVGID